MAPDGVPDARRRAVLRGHVLPPGAAARAAVVPAGAGRDRRGVDRAARRGRDAGREDRRAHRARRAVERLRRAADGRDHARRVLASAGRVRRRTRRLRRRAQVPAADDARVRAAVRRARVGAGGADRDDHARPHGRRRDLRPPRRRVRAVLHGRVVARAALREDALRQRAAGAPVHAGVAGHARRPIPARRDGDDRVPAPRDAARRGRVLLVAGRRQRGRRGEVLRVGMGRVGRARRAGGGGVPRCHAERQLGGDERPMAAPGHRGRRRGAGRVGRRAGGRGGGRPSDAVRDPRGAGAPGHGRQGPHRVERARDRRARRGGPRVRRARRTSKRRCAARSSS